MINDTERSNYCTVINDEKSKCHFHNLQCAYPSCLCSPKSALSTKAQPEVTGAVAWRWGNEAAWLLTDEKPVSDDPTIHVVPLYPPSAIQAAVREKLEEAARVVENLNGCGKSVPGSNLYYRATYEGAKAIRALMESPQPSVEEPAN